MQLTREDVIRIVRQELADNLRIEVTESFHGSDNRTVRVLLNDEPICQDSFSVKDSNNLDDY